MNICVLNGSPKGDISVTLQYVHYLEKVFPQVHFTTYNIAQQIHRIEKDPAYFEQIIDTVRQSDGVLWAFPLYILIVHAHYKRFIELVFEREAQAAFAGKYAATLSTSIHFFDHTAHNYMHGICDDLGMHYVEAFSPDMNDLMEEKGQRQLEQFGGRFMEAIAQQRPTQRAYPALVRRDFHYQPGPAPLARGAQGKKVVILHDGARPGSNLPQMVARIQATFGGEAQVVDLNEIEIKSSCLGCIRCGYNNQCQFEGKDGFIDFYRAQVMAADILVYAGTVVDRYLSSRWKMFFDRSFFNTHIPVLIGKQVAIVVSGPLSQLPNLKEIFGGYFELQRTNLVGIATDEYGDSAEIDRLLDSLASAALAGAQAAASRPATFLGVGGTNIFREDVGGRLRFVFQADYRAYTRLGIFRGDHPLDIQTRFMNWFFAPLLRFEQFRDRFNKEIPRQMILPYQKVLEAVGR